MFQTTNIFYFRYFGIFYNVLAEKFVFRQIQRFSLHKHWKRYHGGQLNSNKIRKETLRKTTQKSKFNVVNIVLPRTKYPPFYFVIQFFLYLN